MTSRTTPKYGAARLITEPFSKAGQSYKLSTYGTTGFHSTASTACDAIEQVGFLPHKILDADEHERLLDIADGLELDAGFYEQWLAMRSVTFTKTIDEALTHVHSGKAGGQGLINIDRLLVDIGTISNESDATFIDSIQARLQSIRDADPVIYVIDLSGLGQRLVDKPPGDFYQFFCDPEADLPAVSEIDPSRLIAKLTL
jgi:hypothetical protein